MRSYHRLDRNQEQIVHVLRAMGMSVLPLVSGADILVGFMRMNFLFEIKDGSKPTSQRMLTPTEVRFHAQWRGQIHTVLNAEEIIRIINDKVRDR